MQHHDQRETPHLPQETRNGGLAHHPHPSTCTRQASHHTAQPGQQPYHEHLHGNRPRLNHILTQQRRRNTRARSATHREPNHHTNSRAHWKKTAPPQPTRGRKRRGQQETDDVAAQLHEHTHSHNQRSRHQSTPTPHHTSKTPETRFNGTKCTRRHNTRSRRESAPETRAAPATTALPGRPL